MTIQPGDPNGIAEHNALSARVGQVAAQLGVTVDLPPVAVLGQSGHVDAHNKLRAAIEKVATEGGMQWAVVSGGTVTEYTHPAYGVMSVHTFTGNGTLTVSTAGLADVLVVGGGSSWDGTASAVGGRIRDGLRNLTAAAHPVAIGTGGSGGTIGQASRLGDLYSGLAGEAKADLGNGAGASSTANQGAPLTSSITGTARTYAAGGGQTSSTGYGDRNAAGVVIVAVKKP